MKILLVGFSDKNATVFKMFCERNFKDITCQSVERQFGERLRLILPDNTPYKDEINAYIIDLYGVGMANYSEKNRDALYRFIGSKPTVLIKMTSDECWLSFTNSVNTRAFYMNSPYSKEDAINALKKLKSDFNQASDTDFNSAYDTQSYDNSHTLFPKKTVQSEETINNINQDIQAFNQAFHKENSDLTHTVDIINNTNSNTSTSTNATKKPAPKNYADKIEVYNAMLNNPQAKHIEAVLKKYFDTAYDTALTRTILSMFVFDKPIEASFDNYRLLLNPNENSVLTNHDINRIIDYLSVFGKRKHTLETKYIHMTILSDKDYAKLAQEMMASGARKIAYITVLWQIAEEVIPLNETVGQYPLPIKVKYIPNFAVMRFVPNYVQSVVSTCLTKPRTIDELKQLFPNLSSQQLNRTILICFISGIVDMTSLLEERKYDSNTDKKMPSNSRKAQSTTNKDISTAKRTGFFKRLLKKLAG